MAGLDGIVNKIEPGQPIDKDLYELPPEEQKMIKQLPGSLDVVLDNLEKDHDFLLKGDVFTPDLIETWLEYKRKNEVDAIRLPASVRVRALLRHLARSRRAGARVASGPACHTPRVTRSLGATIPDRLSRLAGPAAQAPSTRPSCSPPSTHTAGRIPPLVSYAEILALDPARLRLGLHAGSRSGRHLRESGRATRWSSRTASSCCYVKVEGLALPGTPRAPHRRGSAGGP